MRKQAAVGMNLLKIQAKKNNWRLFHPSSENSGQLVALYLSIWISLFGSRMDILGKEFCLEIIVDPDQCIETVWF